MPHHFGRVGSQITGRSNSHHLAPHSFSEIWLFAPPVSRFTVKEDRSHSVG